MQFGATVSDARMMVHGNVFTSGGVTAGIDMALRVAGEAAAQQIQLQIEYDPEPPFDSGTPFVAPPEIVERARKATAERRKIREAAVAKAAAALRRR